MAPQSNYIMSTVYPDLMSIGTT